MFLSATALIPTVAHNMKRISTLIVLLYLASPSLAQIKMLLIDSVSAEPVPFVNVWVIGKEVGATSNEVGELSFSELEESDLLIFSAVGYQLKNVLVSNIDSVILLRPTDLVLNEVYIAGESSDEPLILGGYKNSEIRRSGFSFGNVGRPNIIARYFDGKLYAYQAVYLTELKIPTESDISGAKMSLRIYKKDSSGLPGELVIREPIIFSVKKGSSTIKLDLSNDSIQIPKVGFFVALEWLIIEENKYLIDILDPETNKILERKHTTYQPSVVFQSEMDTSSTFRFAKGYWFRHQRKIHIEHGFRIGNPAMEVALRKK